MTYKDIFGWFDFEDIYDLAINRARPGDVFVEVGCFMGKSTAYMLQQIKNSGKDIKLISVDTFEGSGDYHDNLIKQYGGGEKTLLNIFLDNIHQCGLMGPSQSFLKMSSIESAEFLSKEEPGEEDKLAFVFIDAAHDYDNVKADLNAWFPLVRKGGMFGGHDYSDNCGVPRAVNEFVKERNQNLILSNASWHIVKS